MQEYNFDKQSFSSDWSFDFSLKPALLSDGITWGANDVVLFTAKPDFVSWDDYGFRARQYSPGTGDIYASPYWLNASSVDGSGIVTLVAPSLARFYVPAGSWRGCGPGTVNVGARYMNQATGRTVALWRGRLPLVDGVA